MFLTKFQHQYSVNNLVCYVAHVPTHICVIAEDAISMRAVCLEILLTLDHTYAKLLHYDKIISLLNLKSFKTTTIITRHAFKMIQYICIIHGVAFQILHDILFSSYKIILMFKIF